MNKSLLRTSVAGLSLALVLGISLVSGVAHAEEDAMVKGVVSVSLPALPSNSVVAVPKEDEKELASSLRGNLSAVIKVGDRLIAERLRSLATWKARIAVSKLTASEKADLGAKIDAEVAGLTDVKTKLDAATDAVAAKALVKGVYSDYRVYGVLQPQIGLTTSLNALALTSAKLSDAFVKVQARIDARKAKGKDVVAWQKALDDAKALVPGINAKISALVAQVSAVKPADYPVASKAAFASVKQGIHDVRADFLKIRVGLRLVK